MKGDLLEVQEQIINFRDERNWKQFHNPKDLAISLLLESTELLELFQWKNKEEVDEFIKNHKEDLEDELADVLYWVLLIAHDLNVDLYNVSIKKLEKNKAKYDVKKSKGNHKKYTEL